MLPVAFAAAQASRRAKKPPACAAASPPDAACRATIRSRYAQAVKSAPRRHAAMLVANHVSLRRLLRRVCERDRVEMVTTLRAMAKFAASAVAAMPMLFTEKLPHERRSSGKRRGRRETMSVCPAVVVTLSTRLFATPVHEAPTALVVEISERNHHAIIQR